MMVQITSDEYLELLIDRLKVWCDDPVVVALYEEMYQRYIDEGIFESNTHTIMEIVDNDWVNWCDIVGEDDERWDDIQIAYQNGESEIEFDDRYSVSLEAFNEENKLALIRN